MHLFVGSTNPVKVNAVKSAVSHMWPDAVVEGVDVPSGIKEQPLSDEETREGATNRARAALAAGLKKHADIDQPVGIGLEGGVFKKGDELWSTVWVVVVDKDGNMSESNGARFKVPALIADPILAGGEMGPVVSELLKMDLLEAKQKQGAIGIITRDFVNRTEEYTGIAKLALGLWYGRNWHEFLIET